MTTVVTIAVLESVLGYLGLAGEPPVAAPTTDRYEPRQWAGEAQPPRESRR